jgi:hypothetical protein
MSEARPRELLLVGLQETGKTSYLALFYLAVIRGTEALRLSSYQDDREHLNRISGRLSECQDPRHTTVGEEGQLVLSLEVKESDLAVALRIPDLSGETWEEAVRKRLWSQEIDVQVRRSDAVLLFAHADQIDRGATMGEADRALASLGGPPKTPASESVDPREKKVDMKGEPPTDVQLVDLLELTAEQRGKRPTRTCLLLSAWDTQPSGLTPEQFLAKNLPLLHQYLKSNAGWLTHEIYGVSAQGGSFASEAEALVNEDPLERASVVDGSGALTTIGEPITFALEIGNR